MIKRLAKFVGSAAATAAAVLVGGRVAFADPPRVEPRAPDTVREAPREAPRDARADARDSRIDVRLDRRAHRAPGELGLRLGAIADRGLAIANLVTDSAFYTAGIRPGDYIVSVDGHRIVAPGDFDRYLYAGGQDQPVQIVVWRNGADHTITVQPNVLYSNDANANYDTDLSYFGVVFDPQYTDRLVIQRVLPDSLAFRAGLRAGDVISNWNGQRIRSQRDFARVIHDEKPGRVAFDYTRDGKTMQANANFERREESRTALKPVNPNEPNAREPNTTGREPGRDNIPTLKPPTGVTPPTGREPGATAPNGREPGVNPPAAREPGANPPASREPAPKSPATHEPPRANPPATNANPPRPEPREGAPAPTPRAEK